MDYELTVLNTIVVDVSGSCGGISNNCIDSLYVNVMLLGSFTPLFGSCMLLSCMDLFGTVFLHALTHISKHKLDE